MKYLQLLPFLLLSALLIVACNEITGSSESANLEDGTSTFSITSAGDDGLSEEQQLLYRQDAERLAIRFVDGRDSTQTDIPETLIQNLYNGLVHIVNADHPESKDVTLTYSIHVRNPGSAREILVFADSTSRWIGSWRSGNTETGNAEIDELIGRFDFNLTEYSDLSSSSRTLAILRSDRAINVFAVSRLFLAFDDIENAHPNKNFGDGSDISVLFFDDHLRYTLEYGFGDCPSGCINRHSWKFRVLANGTVEFIGEGGDPLPEE